MVRDLLQLNNWEKRCVVCLLSMLGLFGALYIVLVHQTVAHIVARRSLEADIADLGARVSTLESDYMQSSKNITMKEAQTRGFAEVSPAFFVSRAPQALSLRTSHE